MRFQIFHLTVDDKFSREFTIPAYEIPMVRAAWRHVGTGANRGIHKPIALHDVREFGDYRSEYNRMIGDYGANLVMSVYRSPEELHDAMQREAESTAVFESAIAADAAKQIAHQELIRSQREALEQETSAQGIQDQPATDPPPRRGGRPRKAQPVA